MTTSCTQNRSARRRLTLGLGCVVVVVGVLVPAMHTAAMPVTWSFSDQTLPAGFDYQHGYVSASLTEAQRMAGGAAAGDYDGDGWVDLYVVRGTVGPNLLFRNQGDGTFEEVGAAAGVALPARSGAGPVFADFDGDGWLDLWVGGVDGTPPTLFRNVDGRVFEDVTTSSGIDYSGNTFGGSWGDYDRDGDLDLLLAHWGEPETGTGHLWRNLGGGTFADSDAQVGAPQLPGARDWTFSPNLADMNNDGWPDLVFTADFETSQIYLNNRNGTFGNFGIGPTDLDENGMGAALADYDNDGDLDWFVSSVWDADGDPEGNWGVTGNRLYQNLGTGRFIDVTDEAGVREGDWGWGSTWGDFDNDGHLDLFHVNGWRHAPFDTDPARLFMAQGDGTFQEQGVARGAASPDQGRGVVCFDYDRDGDLDLFIANNSGAPLLLRNDGGNAGNHLSVKLVGDTPNTEALGARVYARVGNVTQMRELRAACNYVSQNPVEAHFGLGGATQVDELRIVWPDQTTETLHDVDANQRLVLHQGSVPVALHDLSAVASASHVLLEWRLQVTGDTQLQAVTVQRSGTAEGPFETVSTRLPPSPRMQFRDAREQQDTAAARRWYRILLHPTQGAVEVGGTIDVTLDAVSGTWLLPLRSPVSVDQFEVRYHIGSGGQRAALTLYDARGHRVHTLVHGSHAPGLHVLQVGEALPASVRGGVYFVRLEAERIQQQRKVVLMPR